MNHERETSKEKGVRCLHTLLAYSTTHSLSLPLCCLLTFRKIHLSPHALRCRDRNLIVEWRNNNRSRTSTQSKITNVTLSSSLVAWLVIINPVITINGQSQSTVTLHRITDSDRLYASIINFVTLADNLISVAHQILKII